MLGTTMPNSFAFAFELLLKFEPSSDYGFIGDSQSIEKGICNAHSPMLPMTKVTEISIESHSRTNLDRFSFGQSHRVSVERMQVAVLKFLLVSLLFKWETCRIRTSARKRSTANIYPGSSLASIEQKFNCKSLVNVNGGAIQVIQVTNAEITVIQGGGE